MLTRTARSRGFTLVEIMIVVAIIGLLVAIAIPNFAKARIAAQKNTCIKNLSTLDAAKQIWGVENGKKTGDEPVESDLVGATLYLKTMPVCPAGGDYKINPVGITATCSISGHVLEP